MLAMEAFRRFQPISNCTIQHQTVVSDLDGTLLMSRNAFPYYMLVAVEAGSFLRDSSFSPQCPLCISHTCSSPKPWLSKLSSSSPLPDSTTETSSLCHGRCCPSSTPTPSTRRPGRCSIRSGRELRVTKSGETLTGLVKEPGVMVGEHKKEAVVKEFGSELPDLGLGDIESDYHFMSICKEGYRLPRTKCEPLSRNKLLCPIIFHDGRFTQRPTPQMALVTFLWLPIGIILSNLRVYLNISLPKKLSWYMCKLLGIKIIVKGPTPPPPKKAQSGVLFVCNHRSVVDPVIISIALKRNVSCVSYSVSRFSEIISPIKTFALSRERDKDAETIKRLLQEGDLLIFPEGTTCREPYLLRFSALFAELTDRIVPVAIFEITFLNQLPVELTCTGGLKSSFEVANYIQRALAETLGTTGDGVLLDFDFIVNVFLNA
ncbi:hypothetical protein K1719_012988 [Acacia pycnantha]|nr:hypothetical protein K1719_012988 [Acacia pycnantha]